MPGLVSFIYDLLQVKAIDTLTQLHCCEGSMIQDVNLKAFTDHSSRLLQQKQEKAQSTFFEGRAWSIYTISYVMLLPVLPGPWGWWLILTFLDIYLVLLRKYSRPLCSSLWFTGELDTQWVFICFDRSLYHSKRIFKCQLFSWCGKAKKKKIHSSLFKRQLSKDLKRGW